MGYLKTIGLVINEIETGEADRIITIFTKNDGKLSAVARNSKKSGNRISSGTQLLCYGEFVLFKGKELHNVSSCEIIYSFYELRNDIIKLTYVSHLLEVVNDVVQENQNYFRVLRLLLNALYLLSDSNKDPELIVRIFEIRLMRYLGYSPEMKACCVCGKQEGDDFFSFDKCGLICRECSSNEERVFPISQGCKMAIKKILYSSYKEIFAFSVSEDVKRELGSISSKYLYERLDKKYNKLSFMKYFL
jgi:DNA repair protein RecO (recombination protein O)